MTYWHNVQRRVLQTNDGALLVRWPGAARQAKGFTLLEIALCIVIIGTGIVAIMQFMGSATRVNSTNTQMSLAIQYARAGWETTFDQGFDVVKFWTQNPPTSAPALSTPSAGYTRKIWVENVDINNLTGASPGGAVGNVMRVYVDIYYNNGNVPICRQIWIFTKPV